MRTLEEIEEDIYRVGYLISSKDRKNIPTKRIEEARAEMHKFYGELHAHPDYEN